MVFTTHLFLFYYLSLFLIVYYLLPFRSRTALIAVCSYLFYGWANPLWPLLMFLSSGVDYVCGLVLLRESKQPWDGDLPPILAKGGVRTGKQRAVLAGSIVSNLCLLAFFKYTGFAIENINALSRLLGQGADLVPMLQIALPVGISFYTFKSMSYAIDVYRGEARPMTNFVDFCCFEAFFPDLVAGPIVRYGAIEQQMRSRSHTAEKFARGVVFFSLGMAKKILIANPLGHVADTAFNAGSLHWFDAWYGVVGYAFQIYFDFSGYSDMACGLALMMGFVLIQNFDSPYQAESITDFWRRWHISLSTWLRDYLYIPLGGNRLGPRSHLRESHARHVDRRIMAWRELELRHLGRDSRRHAVPRANAGNAGAEERPYKIVPRGSHVCNRLHHVGVLPRPDTAASPRVSRVPIQPQGHAGGEPRRRGVYLYRLSCRYIHDRGVTRLALPDCLGVLAPNHLGARGLRRIASGALGGLHVDPE